MPSLGSHDHPWPQQPERRREDLSEVSSGGVSSQGSSAEEDARPFFDLVLAVFSGADYMSLQKRDALRKVYGRYNGWASVPVGDVVYKYSIKVLYVVNDLDAPDDGTLDGDVLFVRCPTGYRYIVEKTKRMVSVTRHLHFRYLLKGDDDTFVCFDRVARFLHGLPEDVKPRVYAGIPTACGLDRHPMVGRVIKDPGHKWFDGKYVNHTLAGLDCYPIYMQGALYVLSYGLVDFLQRGQRHLLTFTNEDVTMGTWLLGVDRTVVPLNALHFARLWDCTCSRKNFRAGGDVNAFYHNCKQVRTGLESCRERRKR
ncbi:unnamed protein product, partial [Phaeothamnion confervicola]